MAHAKSRAAGWATGALALIAAVAAAAQGLGFDVFGTSESSQGGASPTTAHSPTGTGPGSTGEAGSRNGTPTRRGGYSSGSADSAGLRSCPLGQLPQEVAQQARDILAGAPKDDGAADGKHFGNYEGRLPRKPGNYYREYTVKTPGLDHRGERRIVVGGGSQRDPDVWYYTGDHFESFCSIPDAER